jgi:hypothetical protein
VSQQCGTTDALLAGNAVQALAPAVPATGPPTGPRQFTPRALRLPAVCQSAVASLLAMGGDDALSLGYPLMIAINAAVKGVGSKSPRIASCWL